jgi:hypothetical protein
MKLVPELYSVPESEVFTIFFIYLYSKLTEVGGGGEGDRGLASADSHSCTEVPPKHDPETFQIL